MKQLITHSRVQSFRLCRKRLGWEFVVVYRTETDSKALRIGTAGHAGLDALKKTEDINDAHAIARGFYDVCP